VPSGVDNIVITPTSVVVVAKKALGMTEGAGMKVLLLSKRTGSSE
jgi:hypothetical protein